MNISPLLQKIILSTLVISGIGYVLFNTFTGDLPAEGVPVVELVGQEVLILADQLESVNINKTIFSSPLFTSLSDISVQIVEEPTGRSNPFANVGNEVSSPSVRIP